MIVNKNSNLAYRYDYNAEPAYVPDYYPPRRQPARTAPKPVRPAPGSVPHPRRQAKAKAQGLKKSQKFVVIMMVFITAAVFIGIIWRYSIIHDENLTVGNIKEHITEQADRNEKLKMELINQKNLQIVSEKAKGLGMKFPNGEQIIYYGAETTTDNTP